MAKMTDDEFRSVIDEEVTRASDYALEVSADVAQNWSYYFGQPMGNEVDGRSKVVSWDVFEVVETALPTLLEPFFAGDDIGAFEPTTQGDEEYSEQATDYINHLIKKKNSGFLLFSSWLKDGLLSRMGIIRTWWDATEKKRKEEYTGLTDEQLIKMVQDEKITVLTHSATPDPDDAKMREQAMQGLATMPPEQAQHVQQMLSMPPKMLHDIEIEINMGAVGLKIDNVPPDTFIYSRNARNLKDATLVGELRPYTRSDLVEMGFDKDRIDALSDYSADARLIIENETGDDSTQEIHLFYGFVKVDYNGDGIAEYRRVFMGGNDVLENEEVDDHEYSIWSPILIPHQVSGMAYADPIAEIQRIKTALTRLYLDSLYLANNPKTFAVVDQVNLDDLLSSKIGGVVRMKAPGMAGALQTNVVANESLQGIELGDKMRDGRLGVTRYDQGLDASALNTGSEGIAKIMNAAQKRQLMTLRVFAETGCKDLFKRCLKTICRHQDKPATVRLRSEWVDFDPRTWSHEMDVTINVGLGAGDKQQNLIHLQTIGAFMEKAAAVGIVKPENLYNFGKMLMKNAEIQGGEEQLLTDPKDAPPAQKPPPNPLLEVEQVKQQAQKELKQMGMQAEAQKFQAEAVHADKIRAEQYQFDSEIESAKIASNERIKAAEIEAGKEKVLMELAAGIMAGSMGQAQSVDDTTSIDDGGAAMAQGIEPQNGMADLQAIMQSIQGMAAALSAPKYIVRDANGRAVGIHHEQM